MSVSDINYDRAMVRWEPDSPSRLQEAALTLFAERGYEETTVAAIAERAGVTERTFFRHYADKREVLFAGSDVFAATVTAASPPRPTMRRRWRRSPRAWRRSRPGSTSAARSHGVAPR